MAKNGTISLTSSKAWEGKITWSAEQDIAENCSYVYIFAGMWKTDGYLTSSNSYTSGTITIDGESHNLIGHQEFEGSEEDPVCIFKDTITIYHDDDGKGSFSISLSCKGQAGTSLASATLSGSGTAVLDTIHRSGTLSASSGTLGTKQTLTIDSASNLTSTIKYSCGSLSGTIITKTTKKTVEWTPPLELAKANTSGASVTAKLTLTTYSGSTAVGTHTISVFYSIPSSLAPTFTVDFSDEAGYKDTYGDFIQLRSRLKIKVNPTTQYDATIKSCKITVRGESFTDLEATASEIDIYGDIQVYVVIRDSRGKTAQENLYVYFREYSLPTVSSLTVKRCNSNGTSNDQGEYVQVTYTAKATSLDNKNTVAYKLEYKKSTASTYTVVNLTQFANNFYVNSERYIFAADTGSSYDVRFTVTDAFGSTVKTTLASTAATIMHFKANGKGIGLGKVSEVDNAIDAGWDINMNAHRIQNVADPVAETDAVNKQFLIANTTTLDAVYPVNSIYISYSHTSPAELFGGTWTRISKRVLWGAEDGETIGSTGGAQSVTLTIDQIPAHSHEAAQWTLDDAVGTIYLPNVEGKEGYAYRLPTSSVGGGKSHSNMPPWIRVSIWRRTA